MIHTQRIRGVSRNALYKSTFTYLLTYTVAVVVIGLCTVAAMYLPDELRALNRYTLRPSRTVRKVIFSVRQWRPAHQRRHSRWLQLRSSRPNRAGLCKEQLIVVCVNARSVGNKAATLSRTIIDERLDIIAVVETWHERSGSITLRRVVPAGFRCIDASRARFVEVSTKKV